MSRILPVFIGLVFISCSSTTGKKAISSSLYEQWFGTYIRGSKVGYEYISISGTENGYLVKDKSLLSLKMLGQDKELLTFTRATTDSLFRVREFSFDLKSDVQVKLRGEVKDGRLIVTMEGTNIPRSRREYSLKYDFFLPSTWYSRILFLRSTPSRMTVYDPTSFTMGEATARHLGSRQVEWRGNLVEADAFESHMFGASTITYVYNDSIIKVEAPFDITMVLEPMEEATRLGHQRLDVLLLFAVKLEGELDPSRDTLVVLQLDSLRGNLILDFADQRLLKRDGNTAIVEIRRHNVKALEGRPNAPIPDSLRKYLESDQFIQSDHPRIKKLAEQIVGNEEDQLRKARRIMDWVYNNLQKKPTVSIPNAVEVLEMGYGDCNEHATLYTALARAAGIPTDIVVGLIYQDGRYFYHAWSASYIKGEWVWIDPVFGEFPASVGHLMLQRGSIERQSEITGVVGKLRVKVLSRNRSYEP